MAVLDERGAAKDAVAVADGVSVRAWRDTVETARALEALPHLAGAAYAGEVSAEQLLPAARLADEDSDAEWAHRAGNTAASDLRRMVRAQREPTEEEARARRRRRGVRTWWDHEVGMLRFGGGGVPDVDGALVDSVLNRMVDRMTPPKGQPWESRAARTADAIVELARNYAHVHAVEHPTPLFVVQVPMEGPAEVCGIPLPAGMVEKLRTSAKVKTVLVDAHGAEVTRGKAAPSLPPRVRESVLRRRRALPPRRLRPPSRPASASPVAQVLGRLRRSEQPRRRVRRGRHRPPRRPRTPRPLAVARQPQPARRAPAHPS